MGSFLITIKPSEESERGMDLRVIHDWARELNAGQSVEKDWRFRSKDSQIGDRVFLLQQGKLGPKIIGYGKVNGDPFKWSDGVQGVSIEFEQLVDRDGEPLVSKDELVAIPESQALWKTEFSGRSIKNEAVAARLEELIRERWSANNDNQDQAGGEFDAINDIGWDVPDRAIVPGVIRYARNPKIREAVKRRAQGKCEYCGEEGFKTSDGTPYLECHHIIALAHDGADRMCNVIALCPNHHREVHHGQRSEELEQAMIEIVNKIAKRS